MEKVRINLSDHINNISRFPLVINLGNFQSVPQTFKSTFNAIPGHRLDTIDFIHWNFRGKNKLDKMIIKFNFFNFFEPCQGHSSSKLFPLVFWIYKSNYGSSSFCNQLTVLLQISIQNINISEQLQALLAPALLPRSFLSLQVMFVILFDIQFFTWADGICSYSRRLKLPVLFLSFCSKNLVSSN